MNQDKHPQKRSRPPLKNNSKKAEEKDKIEEAIEPIFFAQNDLQADALTSYLQKYFISMMRSGDL